jgi:hypothetical protein
MLICATEITKLLLRETITTSLIVATVKMIFF